MTAMAPRDAAATPGRPIGEIATPPPADVLTWATTLGRIDKKGSSAIQAAIPRTQ
jgi:hypothetical protein